MLGEFARTVATDFPIQGILDHLVERIVAILPVTAAGVTLISGGKAPRYISASSESAMRYEKLQTEIGEGPCLLAYTSGEAVAVPDLRVDGRFPQFTPSALEAGLAAVFTFPLRRGAGVQLGALDLYRDTPGGLEPHDMEAAQTLADVAAAYLLNAEAREEARATSDRFRYSSLHDALTGLPNRLLLQERLEHAARRARRSRSDLAILFIDLDRFKQVNDEHGHHVGDELLVAVSKRLTSLARPGDTLARVAGDEFVFLCEDMRSAADVEVLAGRVDAAFAEPFPLGRMAITVSASVGVAFSGQGEAISDHLVDEADRAMYQAKRNGGARHQVIDLREALRTTELDSLQQDLRAAFAQDQLGVAYQPIVRSTDGAVIGLEALLRWTHPQRGSVPALSVVGLAEEIGLISEIGTWVLDRGCRDHRGWLLQHPDAELYLSVNVSVRELMTRGFCLGVMRVLERHQMNPGNLVLEVTESIFVEDIERASGVLADLKALGIRIALDDFGTGYSSLSYLRRLPVDIVKIDQGFVAEIGYAPDGGVIVAAITNLAHALGLSVIAEGVETQSQRDEILALGCESAQGYFFAAPLSPAEVNTRLGESALEQMRLPMPRPRL
ncbi:MAG TPA: GGDEF domain-containing protein [Actinomycetes bacterium]